ncbi:MAG TPA: nitroreductase family protein [Sphaerochaetaceae bacterium]|jgi:nitroreductase|nr:nitroreductase family protein [Sphaerochaetaceae bacterium]
MNQALDILLQRRSVRAFAPEQITDDAVKTLVDAGLHAATAMNRQSWHLTVVQDKRLLESISGVVASVLIESGVPSLIERGRSDDFSVFHHAPTVIFVSSDGTHYSNADCANACQNICLAAAALGLGSCYIGSFVQAFEQPAGGALLHRFELPEGYRPVFAVAVGMARGDQPLGEASRDWKVSFIR